MVWKLRLIQKRERMYYDELADYFNRGQSLIIYQHRDMKPSDEYQRKFYRINEKVKMPIQDLFFLRFKRFSTRDYLFVLHPQHAETGIKQKAYAMIAGKWSKMFELVEILKS